MKTFLLFAAPPVAGALIGFITNVIAIKMLFRPLREIRLFGIRLPFTPGILPRQRHKIAINIGAMVERELLTPDILRRRLEQDDVRQTVSASLAAFTEKLLQTPLRDLLSSKTEFVLEQLRAGMEQRYGDAAAALARFLRGPAVHRELQTQGRVFLGSVIQKLTVFQRFFVSAAQYEETLNQRMPEIIDGLIDQVEKLLQKPAFQKNLLDAAASALEKMLSSPGKTPGEIFSINGESKKIIDSYLCIQLLRIAGNQTEAILAAVNVKDLVAERIDSLEMVQVEKIILDVMANQLKWINVFGAILGFIIGLFQAALSQLLR